VPTYERLCVFLRDDLKRPELVPCAISVREVIDAITKFKTTGTLCWEMGGDGGTGPARTGWTTLAPRSASSLTAPRPSLLKWKRQWRRMPQ
jgi:hypothetical protein